VRIRKIRRTLPGYALWGSGSMVAQKRNRMVVAAD
jgi:hypothetical protein